ncbi:MAG: hypothetical protein R3B09_28255 [Nannocystaceae bacterium]
MLGRGEARRALALTLALAGAGALVFTACGGPGGGASATSGLTGLTSATATSGEATEGATEGASEATSGEASGEATSAAATGSSGATSGGDPSGGDPSTGVATSETTDGPPIDCAAHPEDPACACDAMEGGEYTLGPCSPGCRDEVWRYALWVTSYNVAGTLGYGEHQGIALLATRYRYDPRFPATDGIEAPWRVGGALWAVGDGISESAQFLARTTAPGGEVYGPSEELPGDSDDLFAGEMQPETPTLVAHPVIDASALCEPPERVIDRRFYNHGRTLAERVPNHAWDSFFWRRGLIPLENLAAFEVSRTHDGQEAGVAADAAVRACLDVLDDGFCDARCGNCSYTLSTGFGVPFSSPPDNQIEGIPQGTTGPYQIGAMGQLVEVRENTSRLEDGRIVWYAGGSSWGRASEVADYAPEEWPDPDPVTVDAASFMSVVGATTPNQPIPSDYDDAFTHCVDPTAWYASQSPILTTSLISGRWGHNSNSDAEAELRQFLDCADDPAGAALSTHWNAAACAACGEPRTVDGAPTQAPCQDLTHTAWSYWEVTPGIHNVDDLDLGRFSAVGSERVAVDHLSGVPDPICAWSGEPVYGM